MTRSCPSAPEKVSEPTIPQATMPGRSLKDIYMATTMTELNKLVDISKQKLGNNPKLLIKTSDTMLKQAEQSDMLGDEEKAYVLFMRFFNIISAVKKMPEYRKQKDFYDKLIGQKNVLKCLDKAEDLSKSLKNRYDFVEAQAVAQKLSSLDAASSDAHDNEANTEKKPGREEESKFVSKEASPESAAAVPAPPVQPQGEITPVQLYTLLKGTDEQMIIMDVQSATEFRESHIQHQSCINVPAEIVTPGTTVTVIEKSLPVESKSLWQQRGHMDHIILVDWSSILDNVTIGTTLRTLKDALFKYDSTVIIRSEPLVLEGGYKQWLYHYPQLSTNPHINRMSHDQTVMSAPLLDFDYPEDINVDDILNPKKPPTSDQSKGLSDSLLQFSQGQNDQSGSVKQLKQVNGEIGGNMPQVDRSTKPKSGTNQNGQQNRTVNAAIVTDGSSLYPSMTSLNSPARSTNRSLMSPGKDSVASENSGTFDDSLEKKSLSALSRYSEELEKEKKELEKIRGQKAEEFAKFQIEKEKICKERESRIARLKTEEEELAKLEKMKAMQAKDLADLMRKKKTLEEDIKRETTAGVEDEVTKRREEETRKFELVQMRKDEEEKQRRMEEVMRLRQERKRKEEALSSAQNQAKKIEEENQEKLRLASEAAERLRLEQERNKETEKHENEDREKAKQREEDRQERLAQARREEESRQHEEQERQKAEREKHDRGRLEREKAERERKELEEKSRADLALKVAQEKMKRLNDRPSMRTVPSPNLPEGWEKQRDVKTGRYFYIDHVNSQTQWEPPVVPQTNNDSRRDGGIQDPLTAPQRDVYTTKLRNEPDQPRSGGLKRSFSSPDITKLMEEESLHEPVLPSVDRTKKPSQRFEVPRPQLASTRPRNLNPTYGNVGSAITGLRNLGNTCYMNSILQCLNNCAPLAQYFLTDRYLYDINRDGGPDCYGYQVVDEFVVIIKALWSGQYRNITPRDFKYIVGKYQPMFAGYDQQDSQEFLTFVMDGLNEGLNKVSVKPKLLQQDNDKLHDTQAAELAWKRHCLVYQSIIVDLFQGMLRSTLTCLTCKYKSVTFEVFMYLSLPIPSGSRCNLQDCLREFMKAEMMTGSSRWKCPQCKVKRDAEKKIDIWKLPPLLIIALNRFVWEGMWRQKINSYVDFPVNDLSLDKFIRGPNPGQHYQLYGVSNHYGTMDGGHYTAFCKNAVIQKWNKFDDHEVFEMSSSEVKTSAGFVLFYTTVNFTAPTYRQPF